MTIKIGSGLGNRCSLATQCSKEEQCISGTCQCGRGQIYFNGHCISNRGICNNSEQVKPN